MNHLDVPSNDNHASAEPPNAGNDVRSYLERPENLQRLLRVAARILPHEAEDALQDGVMQALTSQARYDGRAAVSTWMHRVVVNAALMRRRKAGHLEHYAQAAAREPLAPAWIAGSGEAQGPAAILEAVEERRVLGAAVASLSPTYREVAEACLLDDVDANEVARRLDVGVTCLRMRVARARRQVIVAATTAMAA